MKRIFTLILLLSLFSAGCTAANKAKTSVEQEPYVSPNPDINFFIPNGEFFEGEQMLYYHVEGEGYNRFLENPSFDALNGYTSIIWADTDKGSFFIAMELEMNDSDRFYEVYTILYSGRTL